MSGDEEDIAWEVCAEEEGGLGMGLMLRQIEVGEGIMVLVVAFMKAFG